MPQDHSFDIVSKLDAQELKNAIQQTLKEIATRFDFKGSKAAVEFDDKVLTVTGEDEHRVKAVNDILQNKMVKRGVPLKALDFKEIKDAGLGMKRQIIELQQGIPTEKAREIVKTVKSAKIKVQVAIQGEELRVTGKNKDDLQAVMALLKGADFGINMQFTNYR